MQKPLCSKCGQQHWRFHGCEQVEAVEQAEVAKAAAVESARVIPEFRTDRDREPRDVMRTVRRQATNVFVKGT